MSIIRTKKTKNYSVICNNFFSDTRLSWKAKGLLGYLLTKPDDWEVYVNQLATVSEDGKDSTTAGVNELLELGYIKRKQIREKGKFKYEYEIDENTINDVASKENRNGKTDAEKPMRKNRCGKTVTEKPQLLNTEKLNTEQLNTDSVITESEKEKKEKKEKDSPEPLKEGSESFNEERDETPSQKPPERELTPERTSSAKRKPTKEELRQQEVELYKQKIIESIRRVCEHPDLDLEHKRKVATERTRFRGIELPPELKVYLK